MAVLVAGVLGRFCVGLWPLPATYCLLIYRDESIQQILRPYVRLCYCPSSQMTTNRVLFPPEHQSFPSKGNNCSKFLLHSSIQTMLVKSIINQMLVLIHNVTQLLTHSCCKHVGHKHCCKLTLDVEQPPQPFHMPHHLYQSFLGGFFWRGTKQFLTQFCIYLSWMPVHNGELQ